MSSGKRHLRAARPTSAHPRACSDAIAHLRASDPVLARLIDELGELPDGRQGRPHPHDHYGALLRSIVGQQLSVKAASAIYSRILQRYGGRPPTPAQVLAEDPDQMRAAVGLSAAKVGFLRSLAEHVQDGRLELSRLHSLQDDEVLATLSAVKGIGEWTAQMFLMFHLGREDVLPLGDLGIRRAIQRTYGLPALPDPQEVEAIAQPWRPHRTLACRHLWRSLANEPAATPKTTAASLRARASRT